MSTTAYLILSHNLVPCMKWYVLQPKKSIGTLRLANKNSKLVLPQLLVILLRFATATLIYPSIYSSSTKYAAIKSNIIVSYQCSGRSDFV